MIAKEPDPARSDSYRAQAGAHAERDMAFYLRLLRLLSASCVLLYAIARCTPRGVGVWSRTAERQQVFVNHELGKTYDQWAIKDSNYPTILRETRGCRPKAAQNAAHFPAIQTASQPLRHYPTPTS